MRKSDRKRSSNLPEQQPHKRCSQEELSCGLVECNVALQTVPMNRHDPRFEDQRVLEIGGYDSVGAMPTESVCKSIVASKPISKGL